MKRRQLLKAGIAAGGLSLFGCRRPSEPSELPPAAGPAPVPATLQNANLQYLCPPDGMPPVLAHPSPPSKPCSAPLFVPPVKTPVSSLDPLPIPEAHQLWEQHQPKKFYEIYEQEFKWVYHPDPPYSAGSWGWGFDGMTPGPT